MAGPQHRRNAHHLVMALALASLACGEDSPTGTPNPEPPEVALSSGVAALAASQGEPAPTDTIDVTNAGDGTLTGLTAAISYSTGEPTDWLEATLSGTSAPATLALEAGTTVTGVGTYHATVTVASNGVGDSEAVAVTLTISEGAPPTITVTSPTRAAMLETGAFAASDVQVTGQACHDVAPITELSVNGIDVPVSGTLLCEPFDVTQTSPWGLSTITVRAVNAYGRASEVVQSYLRSPTFAPATLPPMPVAWGVRVHLNQPAIDDWDLDLDDIAGIAEAYPIDLAAELGLPYEAASVDVLQTNDPWNPCTDELEIFLLDISYGTPSILLEAVSSGLDAQVIVWDPSFDVRVRYTGCLGNVTTVDGTYSASQMTVSAQARTTVGLGESDVTLSNVNAYFVSPDLDITTSGFISAVSQMIASLFSGRIESLIEDQFEVIIQNELPTMLEEILDAWTIDQSVQLGDAEVAVHGALDLVQQGTGFLRFGLAASSEPVTTPAGPDPAHGSIQAASGTAPSFPTSGIELGADVRLDLINQILWSAWRSGAFDVADIGAQTGGLVAGLGGEVSSLLPPVLGPGTGGHLVELAWGDLAVAATVDRATFGLPGSALGGSVSVEAYGSARLGLTLGFDDVSHRVEVLAVSPDVQVQVTGGDDLMDEVAIAAAVEDALEAILVDFLPSVISAIPVPTLDLADVGGPQTSLGLADVVVGLSGAHLTLLGDVAVRP